MNELRKVEYKYNDKIKLGKFHEWGTKSVITKNGVSNNTYGIVETKDGAILTIKPSNIKFLNDEIKTTDNNFELFKNGELGVRGNNSFEWHHMVGIYKGIATDGKIWTEEFDVDDFPILRVDDDGLDGYWTADGKFKVIDFNEFERGVK